MRSHFRHHALAALRRCEVGFDVSIVQVDPDDDAPLALQIRAGRCPDSAR
jgi:hypothetical protein